MAMHGRMLLNNCPQKKKKKHNCAVASWMFFWGYSSPRFALLTKRKKKEGKLTQLAFFYSYITTIQLVTSFFFLLS